MAAKNYQIQQKQSDGTLLTLHPETNANMVIENDSKKFVSSTEKTQINTNKEEIEKLKTGSQGKLTEEQLTNINKVPTIEQNLTNTTNKANTAYEIAVGASRGFVFKDFSTLSTTLTNDTTKKYRVGDNLYIETVGVPDYWISKVLDAKNGTYGYYEIAQLETQKVDLQSIENDIQNLKDTKATLGGEVYFENIKLNGQFSNIRDDENIVILGLLGGTLSLGASARELRFVGSGTRPKYQTEAGVLADRKEIALLEDVQKLKLIEVGSKAGTNTPSSDLQTGGLFFKEI